MWALGACTSTLYVMYSSYIDKGAYQIILVSPRTFDGQWRWYIVDSHISHLPLPRNLLATRLSSSQPDYPPPTLKLPPQQVPLVTYYTPLVCHHLLGNINLLYQLKSPK